MFEINSEQLDNKILELYENKQFTSISISSEFFEQWEREFSEWIENNHENDFNNMSKNELHEKYYSIYSKTNPYPNLLEFDLSSFYKA